MTNLSDKLGSLTFTPRSQSPFKAGAIINVASDDVTAWEQNNWFQCDGSEYAEADYAQLFAMLGTKYNTGGETASYFRVPNGPRRTVEVDLDITYSGVVPNGTITQKGYVEQDALGNHYLNYWINLDISPSVSGQKDFTIAGITFRSITAGGGGVPSFAGIYTDPSASASNTEHNCLAGTSTLRIYSSSSVDQIRLNGRVPIDAPTDAFVGADSRFSTFDEALESIPMIKVYDDASNIAMSIADATASSTGAVRLSSDFAAGDGVYGFVQANKVQEKNLTSDVTTSTTITALTFNNLVLGKWYEALGQILFVVNSGSSDSFAALNVTHDGVVIQKVNSQDRQTVSTSGDSNTHPISVKFKATATTLTFVSSSVSSTSYINGTAAKDTFVSLTELNNTVETTDFT